jgi:hypothetical protein
MNPEQDGEDRLRAEIEAYHTAALAYAVVKLGLPDTMGSCRWTAEQLAAEPVCFRRISFASCGASPLSAFARNMRITPSRSRALGALSHQVRRRDSARRS